MEVLARKGLSFHMRLQQVFHGFIFLYMLMIRPVLSCRCQQSIDNLENSVNSILLSFKLKSVYITALFVEEMLKALKY